VPETTEGNYDGDRQVGCLGGPFCPGIPRILLLGCSICGGGCGRVLFSESPPLKRKDSGQTPLLNGLEMVRFYACCWWVGADLDRFGSRERGLQSGCGSGKFEKLLRSDPELWVWVVPGVSVV